MMAVWHEIQRWSGLAWCCHASGVSDLFIADTLSDLRRLQPDRAWRVVTYYAE